MECSNLELLSRSEYLEKPTSVIYEHLLMMSLLDIPDFDYEDWMDTWHSLFKYLVSIRDRLVQLKILHRAY